MKAGLPAPYFYLLFGLVAKVVTLPNYANDPMIRTVLNNYHGSDIARTSGFNKHLR